MSAHLVPCPSCTRHVRVSETLCPFCATALPDELRARAPRALPATRLSRAATYALGIGRARAAVLATGAVLATAAAGCSSAMPVPFYGAPPDLGPMGDATIDGSPASDSGTSDAGAVDASPADLGTDTGIVAMYGGPPPTDAGAQDAGVDFGSAALYGAPPA